VERRLTMSDSHIHRVEEQVSEAAGHYALRTEVDQRLAPLAGQFREIDKRIKKSQTGIQDLDVQLQSFLPEFRRLDDRIDQVKPQLERLEMMIDEIRTALKPLATVESVEAVDSKYDRLAATKEDINHIKASIRGFAGAETVEQLRDYVEGIKEKFTHYTETSVAKGWVDDLQEWVAEEMKRFPDKGPVAEEFKAISEKLTRHVGSTNDNFGAVKDAHRMLGNKVAANHLEIHEDLKTRAYQKDMTVLTAELQRYCLAETVANFSGDWVPKLKFCVDAIEQFHERLNAQDDAIQVVEEAMLQKATKYDVVVVSSRIEHCLGKERGLKEFQKVQDRIDWLTRKLEQFVATEADRFAQHRGPDPKDRIDQLVRAMDDKADKILVVDVYKLMPQRRDVDAMLNKMERLQGMFDYLANTCAGMAKTSLGEPKTGESKAARATQKQAVLAQAEALWSWVIGLPQPDDLGIVLQDSVGLREMRQWMSKRKRGVPPEKEEAMTKDLDWRLGITQATTDVDGPSSLSNLLANSRGRNTTRNQL